jgi:uncharacterized membrane protein (DUF4010 family)
MEYLSWLPAEAQHVVLVLFLSFLIGLEREEHKIAGRGYSFGGVRTYPLIGLIGYAMALVSGPNLFPVGVGFAVVGGFLLMSYWHKLTSPDTPGVPGVTSEISGLATYLIGTLVFYQHFWIATTLCVASLLLLELKTALEGLAKRVEQTDILTFGKFLVLTAVILPVLPNSDYTEFQINPFKTWLVVAAVSAVSYGSYVLQRLAKGQGGVVLAAFLGGAYSSTVTTVALARRSVGENHPCLFSGATLIASGMMYLRLAILLSLFNHALMLALAPYFVGLGLLALLVGWFWSRRDPADPGKPDTAQPEPKNPLELGAAFMFALLFIVMLVVTHLAVTYLGSAGVYTLAAIMGVSDVDPFIMGMTQEAGKATPETVAAAGIVIAAASNNVIKGCYAFALAPRATGVRSLSFLLGLAALGLLPLVW